MSEENHIHWVLFYPPVILDYHKVLVYLKASQIGGVEEWSTATCDRREPWLYRLSVFFCFNLYLMLRSTGEVYSTG